MLTNISRHIDWDRTPQSAEEAQIVDDAVRLSLEFLRGSAELRSRYTSEADVSRYRTVATPIILAAVAANGKFVVAELSETAFTWLAAHGADRETGSDDCQRDGIWWHIRNGVAGTRGAS